MKKIFPLLCFIILFQPLICLSQKQKTKPVEEHYLLTASGIKLPVIALYKINADTLFYVLNNEIKSLPVDSVAAYYNYHRSHLGKGILIGALIGGAAALLIEYTALPDASASDSRQITFGVGG